MKKFKSYLTPFIVGIVTILAVSCKNNDEIKVDPNAKFDAVLEVKEAGPINPNVDVNVDAKTSSTIEAKVSFASTTKSMTRLYITQNISGKGETLYKPSESIDMKADGAVDLASKSDKGFEFQFKLPIIAGIGTGTVVYKFWTTNGNGDFRDGLKRLAVGPGTITLKYGAATNPSSDLALLTSYTDVKLMAPLADGTSKTFVSLADGKVYNVNQGIEFVALWDFGYLYSTADGATLRSPFNYNVPYYPGVLSQPIIDIPAKAGTTNGELNKTYFKASTKTTADFGAITKVGELAFVSASSDLFVEDLATDDIIEFVNQYGKKGLIKVLQVSGTNGADGYIRIAIKVQP